jgi:triacylglycerol lipase
VVLQQRQAWLGLESLAVAEFAHLMSDPVFYGVGVPRGDGRLVLVLPGMFANDWYLEPLRFWLRRIGYRPVPSTVWMMAGCGERLSRLAEEALYRRLRYEKRPVALIGHSGGGILAKALAGRLPEPPSHVVLLGSPVGAFVRSRWIDIQNAPDGIPRVLGAVGSRVRSMLDPDCNAPACGCPFVRALEAPLSPKTRVVSIYSPEDPIVAAGSCLINGARNFEVTGTHSGLAFNRDVYRVLGDELARE